MRGRRQQRQILLLSRYSKPQRQQTMKWKSYNEPQRDSEEEADYRKRTRLLRCATVSLLWHPNRGIPIIHEGTHERTARRDETSSLQISLDDTSRHILKLNVRANELQVENDDLPNERSQVRRGSAPRCFAEQPMEVEMRVVNTSIV
jgi:hypothetical protein